MSRIASRTVGLGAAAIATLAFALPARGLAAAGELDPSFGTGGFTILDDPAATGEGLTDVEILPDGSILGGGLRGGPAGFLLARLSADGAADTSFGSGGISVQPQTTIGDPRGINALDVDPEGRIVAGGLAAGPGMDSAGFGRYTLPNLTPDPTFDANGLAAVDCGMPCDVFDAAATSNSAVIGVGSRVLANFQSSAVAIRVTAAGAPDPSFDDDGIKPIDPPGSGEEAYAVEPLDDGSAILGGYADGGAFLTRVGPTGAIDSEFGTAGFAVHDLGTNSSPSGDVLDLERLPDGSLIAAGDAVSSGVNDVQLVAAKFRSDGSLDPSFGEGGVFRFNPTPNDDLALAVAIDEGGRVVLAGYTETGGSVDTVILRLTPDGRLDPSFGSGGVTIASLAAGGDDAEGLALQPDGKAVVVGFAEQAGGDQLLAARFTADPPCAGRAPTHAAAPGGGALVGTPGDDVIAGGPNPDQIRAGAGEDLVCGVGGNDTVFGEGGDDKLEGAAGKDRLKGGPGKDRLKGGAGRDRLSGGAGKDRLNGGAAKDALAGGGGKDRCNGGPGRDSERGC